MDGNIWEKRVVKIGAALLFLLPFQWAVPMFGSDVPFLRILLPLWWMVFFWRAILSRSLSLLWNAISLGVISFFLALSLGLFLSDHPELGMRKFLYFLSSLPVFFVFGLLLRSRLAKEWFFGSVTIGAIFSALMGIFVGIFQFFIPLEQLFSFWTEKVLPFFLGDAFASIVREYPSLLVNLSGQTVWRVSGFFPDPHMFSYFVGMLFPIAVYFFLEKKGKWRVLYGTGAVLLFFADIFTFSRGGYVGLIAAGTFLATQTLSLKKRTAFLSLIGACSLVGGLLFVPSPISDRFWSSFSEEDSSVSGRILLYKEAVGYISQQPFFGYGLGQYPFVVKPTAAIGEPIYVHNLFLDILTEMGFFGLFGFLWWTGSVIKKLFLEWKNKKNRLALAVLSSTILFLGHSLVETPLYSLPVFVILLLFSAYAARLHVSD